MKKEKIHLKERNLKDGRKSLYLDTCVNGVRSYEFLKLYLIPELSTKDKATNKETLRIAEKIREKRIIQLYENKYELTFTDKSVTLALFMSAIIDKMKKENVKKKTIENYMNLYKKLGKIESLKLSLITAETIRKFIKSLGEEYSPNSIAQYTATLNSVMNKAVKARYIHSNPFMYIDCKDKPKIKQNVENIKYLTDMELKTFMSAKTTKTRIDKVVKSAFLFSCFTGLRYSDVFALCERNLMEDSGKYYLSFRSVKTGKFERFVLHDEAVKQLPLISNGNDDTPLFPHVSNQICNQSLRRQFSKCGIEKKLTFHSSRHTFATMLITNDVSVFVVQSLLGHSSVNTTQIYAKIIDKKKDDAINKIPLFTQE